MNAFLGGAAATSCYLGENLVILNTTNSIIRKEGFYLLKDAVPCDGRITSIELCGVFTSSYPTADYSRVYIYAALYQLHLANGTHLLERITEPKRIESEVRESGMVEFDGGVICTRLSLVEYNWTTSEGNILGVRFNNSGSSCELQTFGTITIQTCPSYAAVETNSSLDMVYLTNTPNVIYNSGIQSEELSSITGVKINLRAIVGKCCS